jgi:S1-C subfamily serine protease
MAPADWPPTTGVRKSRRLAGQILVALLLLLLIGAVAAEGVVANRQSARLDRQSQVLAATRSDSAALRAELTVLQRRTALLEARTKGAIDAAAVAKAVLPSVLRVLAGDASGTAFAFGARPSSGGTFLVTNYHVVADLIRDGSDTLKIQQGDASFSARIVKTDSGRDLAVLQTSARFSPLAIAPATVEPGSPVVAVGSPLGLADSVTVGVVSAIRPRSEGSIEKIIQFDAPINPGNSGGPLIDAKGRVVGVAQAKIVDQQVEGISIAIPIAEVCDGLIRC